MSEWSRSAIRPEASMRSSTFGCRVKCRDSLGSSHFEAKAGATETTSVHSLASPASATACASSRKPALSRAVKTTPNSVGTSPPGVRSNSVWPSCFSVRLICWLTALTETPSSEAAAASDPSRATVSTARRPFRWTRFSIAMKFF